MRRWIALLLTVATGFTGLVYEVTWQKYLATLLGSHSEATAAVLGLFLGGLAAGYALFGGLTRRFVVRAEAAGRAPRLLLAYGAVEAAIGVYAFAFPFLFRAVQALSFEVPHGDAGLGFAFDFGLSALLIVPPTVLMGATIPVLTQALARSLGDATRFHALIYAFNTVGAFAGALAAGFVLIPRLGLVGVMWAMGAINLGAGASFALLGLRARAVVKLDAGAPASGSVTGFATYAVAAGVIGFTMMSVQTVLIRLGGLAFGSSEYTFAMVVAVFVLCIALGSFTVSLMRSIPPIFLQIELWALVLLLYFLYGLLPEAPYWIHVLRTFFRDTDSAFLPYYAAGFLTVLVVIGPPVLLSGAALPLLFHDLRRELGDLGAVAGRLYSWNTVGSLAGALLGGYALLFWLDLHHVYRIAVGTLAVAAALLSARRIPLPRPAAIAVLLFPILGALALRTPWSPELLSAGLFRVRQPAPYSHAGAEKAMEGLWKGRRIVFYQDDPSLSVTVIEQPTANGTFSRSIATNGKIDGNSLFDYTTTSLVGILPSLLAKRAERAFVIGLGTGVTAGELASLDTMTNVTVAEISSGVLRAAPFFDFANQNASSNPKIRFVRSDAYRALVRSEGGFDVIVSEPSNPWVTGVEMLFSREFLETARRRLSPGGVYAQWFHQYETNAETIQLVLRTYASVFDRVSVWYTQHADLVLLGFADGAAMIDLERLERRARRPDFAAALGRAKTDGIAALLSHELLPMGVVHAAGLAGPVHTLFHPRLSHAAGRAFYAGSAGALPFTGFGEPARVGAQNSLLRRFARRWNGVLPDHLRERVADQACANRTDLCAAVLGAWRADAPKSPAFEKSLREAMARPAVFGERINAQQVAQIGILFPEGPFEVAAELSPQLARRATRFHRRFYQHSHPFAGERLLEVWSRCKDGPEASKACARGLEEARGLLERGVE